MCGRTPKRRHPKRRRWRAVSTGDLLAWAFVALVTGCSAPERDLFHVESAGARLPVVVYGPRDATTLVLFQHGGPDGAAGIDPLPPGLAQLIDTTLVAVWAQRSTGLSSGISSTRDNTIAQHVLDLDLVRRALALRLPDVERVVLAGHSWGVALSLAYLDRFGEAGLHGLVLSDGFDAYDDNADRSLQRLAELADAHAANNEMAPGIAAGDSWQDVARFAREHAQRGAPYALETIVKASEACARLEADLDRPEPLEPTSTSFGAVTSPIVVPDGLLVAWNFRSMIPELMSFDLADRLVAWHLPTLLVWGEGDCRVPVATGASMRDRFGGDTTLEVVAGATHFAVYSQPQAFADPTRRFLEALP